MYLSISAFTEDSKLYKKYIVCTDLVQIQTILIRNPTEKIINLYFNSTFYLHCSLSFIVSGHSLHKGNPS